MKGDEHAPRTHEGRGESCGPQQRKRAARTRGHSGPDHASLLSLATGGVGVSVTMKWLAEHRTQGLRLERCTVF